MITVGIIFGGRSVEHEVSIITGYQALGAIDRERYRPVPVYLARDNVWYVGEFLQTIDFFRREHPPLERLTRVLPCPDPAQGKLVLRPTRSTLFARSAEIILDCVLPATHGTYGEDGCLQGLLEMSGVPYAGSDVRASAVGMDKVLTKAILAAAGLPHLEHRVLSRTQYQLQPNACLAALESHPGYPLMVKPAVLGSSVAVGRAESRARLKDALDLAFRFCDRALTEPALTDFREVNCAVLDGDPPIPSVLEQPIRESDLLRFQDKYQGGKSGSKSSKGSKGMASQQRLIPAPLDEAMTKTIQEMAVRTFQAIGAGGVARVDFLIDRDNRVFVNELNNIPGSFAFYLWENMGKSFRELLTRMIDRAFEIRRNKDRTTYAFESNLLAG